MPPSSPAYRDIDTLILTIDGLQPEKGHKTLYVVRELRANGSGLPKPCSPATAEVRRLVAKAKQWAENWASRCNCGCRTSRMPSSKSPSSSLACRIGIREPLLA